jgi:superfamily I DNA/RNA helicase
MSWLVTPSELTPEQQRAVQLGPTEHRAILGGPGSGKTQILLHRARYLCDTQRVSPERFRIFVYTNVLKDYIKAALRDLRLPEENVVTFDHWCRTYYQAHINSRLPWDSEKKCPDFDEIRRAVLAHASSHPPLFDFVMVDEGQDLTDEIFAFLGKVSRHVTVCLDNKQQIYDSGSTEAGILASLGIRKRNINLIEAFRVCPYLVEVASHLISDPQEREAFRNQTRQPQTERQTPLLYFYRTLEDDRKNLQQIVRERQLKGDRIAILLPQNRHVFGCANGLLDAGIEIEVPPQRFGKKSYLEHDFSSSRPKLMSYHSAKGLTFDSVFMPGLTQSLFPHASGERLQRLLFVAITRATKWCYISTPFDRQLSLIQEKLMPLAFTGKITTMESGARSTETVPQKKQSEALDFL